MLLAIPTFAHAEWPEANPARPSFSDNADVTERGALEVEAGIATEGDAEDGVTQMTLKYGVLDNFDVRVNLESVAWGHDFDLTAYGLLLKYTARPSADRTFGFAVEPYVNFPAPDDSAGFGGGLFLVSTYKRGPLQIDGCVVTDIATPTDEATAVTVSPIVALGFPIVGELGAYIEPGVELAVRGDGSTNPFVGGGLTYAVTKFLVVDAAFYVEDEPRELFLAGLTYAMFVPHH